MLWDEAHQGDSLDALPNVSASYKENEGATGK
jgi:hypothetical protein